MGMEHGWVPHLPPGTRSSVPHVLQGSHTLQSHCCMFHYHSRCTGTDHLRLLEIYAQSTRVIRTSMVHAVAAHPAMHQIQLEYHHRTTTKCPSKPTRLPPLHNHEYFTAVSVVDYPWLNWRSLSYSRHLRFSYMEPIGMFWSSVKCLSARIRYLSNLIYLSKM